MFSADGASVDPDAPLPSSPTEVSGLRARLLRGVLWNVVGTVFNQGSTFVVNVILANLWGLGTFGEYAIVQSTVAAAASMAQFATGYTATKYIAEFRLADPARTGRVIALCALVAGVIAVIAGVTLVISGQWLAGQMLNQPTLAQVIMSSAGVVAFSVLSGFLTGALAGFEQYAALARAGIVAGLLYTVLCSLGGGVGGLIGAILGQSISAGVLSLWLFCELRAEVRRLSIGVRIRDGFQETAVLFTFALPAALNNLVALPAIWLASALLVRQPQGLDEMALFAAANNFRIIVLFLPNIVNNVGMSLLNNQRGASAERSYRRVFWANIALTGGAVAAGAGFIAFSGRLLLGAFGPEFDDAYPALLILMAATIPEGLALATVQTIQSHGRMWLILLGRVLPCYAVLLFVAVLFSSKLGARGLALAYLIGWSVALASDVLIIWRTGVWSARAAAFTAR